jgi:hypothetical protein
MSLPMLFDITYVNATQNQENLTLSHHWFNTKCETYISMEEEQQARGGGKKKLNILHY